MHTHVINSSMAIAVDQCHGFKPTIHNRRCRLRSFPHLDISPLDLDPAFNHQFTRHPPLNLDLTTTTTSPPPATSPNIHRSFSSPCWTSSSCSANSNNYNNIAGGGDHHHHHHHDQAYASAGTGHINNNNSIPRLDVIGGHGNRALRALVVEAAIAMASGMQLIPVAGGLGGSTYCLRNRAGENLAVLKPIMDQDDHHLSLISGGPDSFMLVGRPPGLIRRHSIRAAHTAMSEVAAYLLDHGGFSGVPPTALVKVSHGGGGGVTSTSPTSSTPPWKIASIQRFVAHDYDAGDVGPSRFSVSSVHRIGILDVRLLNIDRHTGNILVKNVHDQAGCCLYGGGGGGGDCELVPIDHELCLPEKLDDPYFEWLHWPQASVPFSESEAEYISSLNPLRDAELLRAELPMLKEASIRVLVLCTVFLKRAAEAGLCLADIGGMMTREYQNMSQLEALCRRAQVGMAKIIFMRKMMMIRNNIHDKGGGGGAVEDHSGLDDHMDDDDDDDIDQYYFAADDDGGPAGLVSISTDHQNIIMGAVDDEGPPHSFLRRGKKPPKVPKKTLSMKVTSTVTGEYSANYYYCPYSATTTTTTKFGKDDDQEGSIDRDQFQGSGHRGSSELLDRVNIGIRSEPVNGGGGGGRFLSKSTSFCASRSTYIGLHEINGGFDSEKYYSAATAAGISFQGLSEGEWKLFMEKFEELLPSAFEARKGGRRA